MEIKFKSIASVQNDVKDRMDSDWGRIVSRITLSDEYAGGFKGLETFSHAIIITYLHEAHFDRDTHLQRHPRNQKQFPLLGIFSQRGKNRPNPIGITSVKITKAGDNYIEVTGLDAINGTPVLDVKPYFPSYDKIEGARIPNWVEELMADYF